jgi:hypothetical protein
MPLLLFPRFGIQKDRASLIGSGFRNLAYLPSGGRRGARPGFRLSTGGAGSFDFISIVLKFLQTAKTGRR